MVKAPWFNRRLIFLAKLLSIILVLTFCAKKVLDPNRYKDNIQQYLLEKTGQTVLLQGDVRIQYFPFPVLEANQLALKEAGLTAEVLKIYPDLYSLFSHKKYLEIDLKGVQHQSYSIPELHTQLTFENGFFALQKTKGLLQKNNHQAKINIDHIEIDTNKDILRYVLRHHDQNFPLSFFVSLMREKKLLVGEKTRLKVELTAVGNDFDLIKKSLIGNFEMEIEAGKFYGTDVIKTLEKAKSFVGALTNQTNSSGETPFDSLTMHAKLKNGVLENTLLNIDHHHYALQGSGHVNLNNNTLHYRVEAVYKQKINKVYGIMRRKSSPSKQSRVHSKPLIIDISGPLKKPNIDTDFNSYLDYVKSLD